MSEDLKHYLFAGGAALVLLLVFLALRKKIVSVPGNFTIDAPSSPVEPPNFLTYNIPPLQVTLNPWNIVIGRDSVNPDVSSPCECDACNGGGESAQQTTYSQLVDYFNSAGKTMFDNYLNNVVSAIPPYIGQFLNNAQANTQSTAFRDTLGNFIVNRGSNF